MANHTDGIGAPPIDISNGAKLWGGTDKTNGFLHKNVDGRIPALKESWASIITGATNPIYEDMVVPYGNAFWLNLALIDAEPHTLRTEKPAKGKFEGILLFEQGLQTGNPVLNYGVPVYSKGTIIRTGLVGYKASMAAVGKEEDYYAYLKADPAKDVATVRKTYKDWVALLKAGSDGDKLGLFFGNDSGFPIVALVEADDVPAPELDDATFAGFAVVFEPENEAIYFEIKGY